MKLLINAKNLSLPTIESMSSYAHKKFKKLVKFTPKKAHHDPVVILDAKFNKRKKIFTVKVVLTVNKKSFIYKVEVDDPRAAIDIAVDSFKQQLSQTKQKGWKYGF